MPPQGYFVKFGKNITGPVNEERLLPLWKAGKLPEHAAVSLDKVNWTNIKDFLGLYDQEPKEVVKLPTPPPPGASRVFSAPVPPVATPPQDIVGEQWHYTHGGKQAGQISGRQLKELASSGQLSPTDMVWKEGMPKWIAAQDLKGLFVQGSISVPPPLPGTPPQVPAATPTAPLSILKAPVIAGLHRQRFASRIENTHAEDVPPAPRRPCDSCC